MIQKIYKFFGISRFIFLFPAYKENKKNYEIEIDKKSLKKN